MDAAATGTVAARYRRFAELEAPCRSPLYAALAHDVRRDPELLAFLAALPEHAWQPQLLFGAVQYLQGPLTTRARFADAVRSRRDDVAAVMRARTTRTNIPARCATLLPALAALPPPLALVEVGASAGLCLYPDRYSYDATLVVVHSAVLPYVAEAGRRAFVAPVRSSRAVWLANESPARIPGLDPATVAAHPDGQFPLCRDGRPVARADPHAAWVDWL